MDENKDVFAKNRYITHFNECYDILDKDKRTDFISTNTVVVPESKSGFFDKLFGKKEEVAIDEEDSNITSSKNENLKEFDVKIDQFMESDFEPRKHNIEKNIVRDFEQMWEFAQFVRYAEKVIFYNNDLDKPLYVDSDLLEEKERKFSINKDDFVVLFTMSWIYDKTREMMLKTIKINVERNFGKQMKNEFVIVNSDVKINDQSDFTLIGVINSLLYDATLETYRAIMRQLLEFFEERMTFPCQL